MTGAGAGPTGDGASRPWQDTSLSVTDRVGLLLSAMTLEEKVAQLGSRWVGNDMQEEEQQAAGEAEVAEAQANAADAEVHNVAPMQDVFAASGSMSLEEASRNGLGHLTRVYGSVPMTAEEGAAELVRQQRVVL
jgi:hypothetical protein